MVYAGHWPQSISTLDFEISIRKFVKTQFINKEGQLGELPISFSFFIFLCMSVWMVIYVEVHVFSYECMYACKGMFKYLQMHVCVQVHAHACMRMCACEGQRTDSDVFCLFVLFIFLAGTLTSLEFNKQSSYLASKPRDLPVSTMKYWDHGHIPLHPDFFLMWVLWNQLMSCACRPSTLPVELALYCPYILKFISIKLLCTTWLLLNLVVYACNSSSNEAEE